MNQVVTSCKKVLSRRLPQILCRPAVRREMSPLEIVLFLRTAFVDLVYRRKQQGQQRLQDLVEQPLRIKAHPFRQRLRLLPSARLLKLLLQVQFCLHFITRGTVAASSKVLNPSLPITSRTMSFHRLGSANTSNRQAPTLAMEARLVDASALAVNTKYLTSFATRQEILVYYHTKLPQCPRIKWPRFCRRVLLSHPMRQLQRQLRRHSIQRLARRVRFSTNCFSVSKCCKFDLLTFVFHPVACFLIFIWLI